MIKCLSDFAREYFQKIFAQRVYQKIPTPIPVALYLDI